MKHVVQKTITTFSGRKVDPLALKPQDICIEDIAHSLAHLCRYGGHLKNGFYSVAEHSILVALRVFMETLNTQASRAALLHDASEAYMQDLVSPIKYRIPRYCELEHKATKTINNTFSLKIPIKIRKIIRKHDVAIRANEPNANDYLGPKEAKRNFLRLYRYLTKAVENKPTSDEVLTVFSYNI
jgi:uncharacterized protein